MNNLINISNHNINNQNVNTVNARELHEFLEVGKDFSTWLKARIDKYEFQENLDFIVFPKFGENPSEGGRPRIEYYLTIDMAKELAMVENNSKGKQARKYFIEVEKKFKKQLNDIPTDLDKFFTNPNTILQIAHNWKKDRDKLIQVEQKLIEAQPKVAFANAVEAGNDSILIGELAKLLRQNGIDIGQNRLFDWLREHEYLHKNKNIPTQKAMNLGLFNIKETLISKPDGESKLILTPKVTGKGQSYFLNKFLSKLVNIN